MALTWLIALCQPNNVGGARGIVATATSIHAMIFANMQRGRAATMQRGRAWVEVLQYTSIG